MISYHFIYSNEENPTEFTPEDIADFFYTHLDEYGDEKQHILKSIEYAYGRKPGMTVLFSFAQDDEEIAGGVIINDTNMGGYIPEHILVYIAVGASHRGQGVGSELMERTIEGTEGDIALHVEPDNPAKFLYEKYGMTNKYLEMRLKK